MSVLAGTLSEPIMLSLIKHKGRLLGISTEKAYKDGNSTGIQFFLRRKLQQLLDNAESHKVEHNSYLLKMKSRNT